MSAGGVFKLIANDGKADKMIMATDLLNNRIKNIMCMKAKQGLSDTTPSLADIEQTHILFVNAHFKPFASLAYEYNKVRTNTGTSQFGGSLQFSIPQFGDFFNDMVINATLGEAATTKGSVPALPAFVGASDQSLSATASVSGKENTTSGTYTKYTHEYVNSKEEVLSVGADAYNYVRYVEFPGQRLFKKVKFEVNGNPLDEYPTEAYIFFQKFRVPPHKMTGWKRLVGQEIEIDAYIEGTALAGTSNFASSAVDLKDVNGNDVAGGAKSFSESSRKLVKIVNGPQTAKLKQPALDLWIPLIFWFNTDPRLSIASVAIPYGQRFITIDLESQANIVQLAPGDLFLRLTVEEQYSQGTGKGTAAAIAVERVKKYITLTPVYASNSVLDATQQITNMELYINNIFVNPEIHDIYIKRIGFSLIRVHKFQSSRQAVSSADVLLSQLKFPIEYCYVGYRPAFNISASNPNQYRDWHRMTLLTNQVVPVSSSGYGDVMIDDTVAFNASSAKHKLFSSKVVDERVVYPSSTDTVNTLKIQAHGIDIYTSFKSTFFRDYIPYTFGGGNVITPEDPGAFMINFCLYPGTYQPSGHINVSRAREFYLGYTSDYIGSDKPADQILLAKAINFLLISDGSAVLRYST